MMRPLHLNELAQQLPGWLQGQSVSFTRVSTDTRQLQAGDLFVALRGERFDAHRFLAQAAEKACALVVDTPDSGLATPQWVVKDTTLALGGIGAYNRAQFEGPVVAITGSSGKTTVKTMLAGILAQCGPTLATRGNLNNHIGVPLTLLELAPEHRYGIIEMGASGPGEIAYLCTLARPQIALVNNVMAAHIEGFGSLQGVAEAKGEIYRGLQAGGTAIINLDDSFAGYHLERLPEVKPLTYALRDERADFFVRDLSASAGQQTFELVTPEGALAVQLTADGEHNVRNALAAAACAYAAGATLAAIAAGLNDFTPVAGRMSRLRGTAGALIIDDSYNANPGSVRAAIDVLAAQPGERWLVLGDMAELGEDAAAMHAEVGRYAHERGIDALWTLGTLSEHASTAFGHQTKHFQAHGDLIAALKESVHKEMNILIKGSRSSRMDDVVNALLDRGDNRPC
ncbi:UDP-N-acetylmuramoyl-tripeptide--D-alanyl-D-alanine ligase [Marinimicrobium alkaliphilum]|uniref:UDP-N-acetylmuramoyl-tripeptide--D-alanyl-D- alanine ligase n=1 Tax=Marinimicrobium alkaliphilum TaxID=2202654 RepID=UPI000DBAD4C0|nr:UDP-N-acetylmuramoyl-tripeptide--D-alanyl-D-alanine ligase [Marinimicrobium alkaliphilum]